MEKFAFRFIASSLIVLPIVVILAAVSEDSSRSTRGSTQAPSSEETIRSAIEDLNMGEGILSIEISNSSFDRHGNFSDTGPWVKMVDVVFHASLNLTNKMVR